MSQRKKPPNDGDLNAERAGESALGTTGQTGKLDTPIIPETDKKFNRELSRLDQAIINYQFMIKFNTALLESAKIERALLLVEMGALDDTQIP